MHLRDYAGFCETRRQMLLQNSGQMESWSSYALSCFLNGDLDNCISSIESIMRFEAEAKTPLRPNQALEIFALHFRALEAKGAHKKALKLLEKNSAKFVDRLQFEEFCARTKAALGDTQGAVSHYESLLERNSMNCETYYSILKVHGVALFDQHGEKATLDAAQQAKLLETTDRYAELFPRVNAHTRIALRFASAGPAFAERLAKYVRPLLVKGAPAVIQDLRELYSDSGKSEAIEALLLGYLASMEKEMTLAPGDAEEQDPTVLLWLLYFISYHYMWVRDYGKALQYVNRAIEHTPTLLELYTLKGKIY